MLLRWPLLTVALPLILIGCGTKKEMNPAPKATSSAKVTVGQVWRYKTRDSETESRVTIGKIETIEKLGTIVHVKITGLKMQSPSAPDGISKSISHSPMVEQQLVESLVAVTNESADLSGFDEGYKLWLEAYQTGKGGVFTIEVKEIVNTIEFAMNKGRTK